ncbi:hypothetical protein [Mesorhizobium sp. ES1-3]|uniref:hypothetical protein n=1 Tax=Mesorhizobium sp. ES1-3 TaxID=2876628 RepID=UPI001CCF523E|nr:hypothetical protein [Mesorhizobium sp. ES1-3]MBZ9673429.1 hypothetical protein [Mesorhizobium sp. ES1-3]
MRDQDKFAVAEAMADLAVIEDRTDSAEAIRIAISQMVAGALFIETRAGKARADSVVAELFRAQCWPRQESEA